MPPPVPLREALENTLRRMLQEAMAEGLASHWRKRAGQLESARPASTDFHGQASSDELRARYVRCAEAAAMCRVHAGLLEEAGPPEWLTAEVEAFLGSIPA